MSFKNGNMPRGNCFTFAFGLWYGVGKINHNVQIKGVLDTDTYNLGMHDGANLWSNGNQRIYKCLYYADVFQVGNTGLKHLNDPTIMTLLSLEHYLSNHLRVICPNLSVKLTNSSVISKNNWLVELCYGPTGWHWRRTLLGKKDTWYQKDGNGLVGKATTADNKYPNHIATFVVKKNEGKNV
jgi:hypothetical protein